MPEQGAGPPGSSTPTASSTPVVATAAWGLLGFRVGNQLHQLQTSQRDEVRLAALVAGCNGATTRSGSYSSGSQVPRLRACAPPQRGYRLQVVLDAVDMAQKFAQTTKMTWERTVQQMYDRPESIMVDDSVRRAVESLSDSACLCGGLSVEFIHAPRVFLLGTLAVARCMLHVRVLDNPDHGRSSRVEQEHVNVQVSCGIIWASQ